jgi:putative phosphoesterase
LTAVIQRLGVLGDVHGEHRRLHAAQEWFAGQRLDAVVCTGDVADGAGCINRCCELLREAGVLTVAGNHDRWMLSDRVRHVSGAHHASDVDAHNLAYLEDLPRTREIDTAGGPVLLCHGVGNNDMAKVWPGTRGEDSVRRSAELDDILRESRYRLIVHGHLHYRVLIDFEDTLLLNAGTLKGDRGGVSIVDFEAGSVTAFELAGDDGFRRSAAHSLEATTGRRVWKDTVELDGQWQPVLL